MPPIDTEIALVDLSNIVHAPLLAEFIGRFWSRVSIGPGCWLWTRGKDSGGYGAISFRGRMLKAHRVAWLLTSGDVPPGLLVLHHCDTPPCCNPVHLFVGTHADNSADMARKGRSNAPRLAGEQNPFSKLTADRVREIRQARATGLSYGEIAKHAGISKTQVANIVTGAQWGSVA